jgi:hypothetical protein
LTDNSAVATKIGQTLANVYADETGTAGTPYYYWVKAVDHLGNTSGFPSSVTGTPRNVAEGDVQANAITYAKISVVNLAAIKADMGDITAGTLTLSTSGYIRGGQTGYNTGIGFFLGYSTDAYKFSIGNPASNYITFDGSVLIIAGAVKPNIVANDDLLLSADTERSTINTEYTQVKQITVQFGGTLRIKFDLRSSADGAGAIVKARIYRNGVAVGTERSSNSSTYATRSEDISGWTAGDICQLYYKRVDEGTTCYIRNFRVYGTILTGTITTD